MNKRIWTDEDDEYTTINFSKKLFSEMAKLKKGFIEKLGT